MPPLPPRLARLAPAAVAAPGLDVRLAAGLWARLAGLAGLAAVPEAAGLLLPLTRSIHTFGMRVAIDVVWLAADGTVVRIDAAVRPGRLRCCRDARCALELAAGASARAGLRPGMAV
jgi:uncharacterized protein